MNVRDLLKLGIEKRVEADARKEASLPTAMRFGNSGAIIGGKVYGNCPRLAHLRLMGFQEASDEATQIMFASGRAVENIVYDFLSSSYPPERILREEEAPARYTHSSGVMVTGRPDFILTDENGKYVSGIECKGKMSYWGVKGLVVDSKGDAAHLVQAFHYLIAHNLETYALVYVTPVRYLTDSPEQWPEGALSRSGRGYAVNPRIDVLQLSKTEDGRLVVQMPDGKEHTTKLKEEHIQAYYSAVADMGEGKPLPVPPTSAGLFGKASWSKCDYCSLRQICDTETSYGAWLDRAVDIITESWQEKWPALFDPYLSGWGKE